ncbi:YSIRK-type signal peptide-containing protein [Staphylococcus aureus]|nr:YSIRK-type signal peptide-containing protein [Staphylococcus aureus]
MNYRDKIQKFSIRKYTVGTFSTVIATLVFLGLNTSQAQAAETNQPASALKQKQQNGDTQTENREVEVQNSQMVNHYLRLLKMNNQIIIKQTM